MTFEPGILFRTAAEVSGWLLMAYAFLLGARLLLKHLVSAGRDAWKETAILKGGE
jgi:hypothetical protein